jgi:hypothetical protein
MLDPKLIARRRRRDIEQIVRHKGADILDVEGLLDVARTIRILAQEPRRHLAVTFDDVRERLGMWCKVNAPTFDADQISSVARAAMRGSIDKADVAAERFDLRYAERTAWGITTIGAIDADAKERQRLRKIRRREANRRRMAARRKSQGALSREKYLAGSLTRAKPWLAAGMSRASWYRHRRSLPTATSLGGENEVRSPSRPHDQRQAASLRHPRASVRQVRRSA